MHIYITKMNFKPVNIDTVCFFYRKVVNFWYITCFFPQFDSNLAPIPIRRLFQLKNWRPVWGDAEMLSFFWTWNQCLEMFLLPQAMELSAINYFRRFFEIFMGKACKILAGSNWLYTFTETRQGVILINLRVYLWLIFMGLITKFLGFSFFSWSSSKICHNSCRFTPNCTEKEKKSPKNIYMWKLPGVASTSQVS